MGRSEDGEDTTEHRFDDLCLDLNMDTLSKSEAWQSFQRIRENYTLEGDGIHWLACALYVSCRKSLLPTVGKEGMVEGNCVSLTRLLRSAKLSLIEFFKKMKKWADMANLPQEFRDKIDRLERNFAVSTVIFKKFEPIWLDIFKNPNDDPPKQPRSRKQRRLPCTVSEVFNFCWTMFVQVKGNYPAISDDLVNSYHLLLCCLDWFYANALLSNRRDLLNSEFSGLPESFHGKDWKPPTDVPCEIGLLCEKHEGLELEAKGIKEHWWKPYIKKLFQKHKLKGRLENLSGVLEIGTFETNSKEITKAYEEYVLNVGDFDERIFLGEDAHVEIGTPAKTDAPSMLGELHRRRQAVSKNLQMHFSETQSLFPSTPLTGRRYLKDKETHITPVSTATQSVSRLQSMLVGRKTSPSEVLLEIFSSCSKNPHEEIVSRVKDLGEMFCMKYAQPSENYPGSHVDFAKKRLQLAETLYYKVLENIMLYERNRLDSKNNKNIDLFGILGQEYFHKSLFACCVEIVIFSYNSQRIFPWIMETFDLTPYSFFKVIEVLIRAEEGLSRDVVKHLNHIEENILDCLAWKVDSPMWDAIEQNGDVPSVEEVLLPTQFDRDEIDSKNILSPITSPMVNPQIRRVAGIKEIPQSPISVTNRFISPAPGSAKRKLFGPSGIQEHGSALTVQQAASISSPRPDGTSLLASVLLQTSQHQKAKKTGSLALFLRKMYHLASVRLRDLCERLDVDSDLRSKIWTCFEHCIIHHHHLLQDRHLDQILMCSMYVMSKVTQKDRSFQDIMRCYRLQPQAQSHIYRSVLLSSRQKPQMRRSSSSCSDSSKHSGDNVSPPTVEEDAEKKRKEHLSSIRSSSALPTPNPDSQPPTPTRLAGTGSSFQFDDRGEDRGDLIKFYNSYFVKKIKSFALKFSKSHQGGELPPLSPLPLVRSHPQSPRRVSTKHSVYVSPHKSHTTLTPHMLYCFNRSPAKDLRAINNMLRLNDKGQMTMKRLALGSIGTEDAATSPKRICPNSSPMFSKKLEAVVLERKGGPNSVNGSR